MSANSSIPEVAGTADDTTGRTMYDLDGRQVPADSAGHGIYIVREGRKATKILR